MNDRTKGYLLAASSRIFGMGYLIFATFAFKYYNPLTTSVLWFGSVSIYSIMFVAMMGNLYQFKLGIWKTKRWE